MSDEIKQEAQNLNLGIEDLKKVSGGGDLIFEPKSGVPGFDMVGIGPSDIGGKLGYPCSHCGSTDTYKYLPGSSDSKKSVICLNCGKISKVTG